MAPQNGIVDLGGLRTHLTGITLTPEGKEEWSNLPPGVPNSTRKLAATPASAGVKLQQVRQLLVQMQKMTMQSGCPRPDSSRGVNGPDCACIDKLIGMTEQWIKDKETNERKQDAKSERLEHEGRSMPRKFLRPV